MNRNIHIVNSAGLINAFNQMQCGKLGFISSEDFEIRFADIAPPDNYSAPADFPFCCDFHKGILKSLEEQFEKFPFCCAGHSKLATEKWFDKNNYKDIPIKTVNALGYCEFHVDNKIGNEDWYEDITEYFEYCVDSFGQFPSEYGPPLGLDKFLDNLINRLQYEIKGTTYDTNKLKRLISFLDKYLKPDTAVDSADINILIERYKEWLKIFPFQISYLAHLKEHFEKQIPIISGAVSQNRYTGHIKGKVVSYEELLNYLVKATTLVLQTVNGLSLFQKGKLDDIENKQLDLINANRKIELLELGNLSDKNKKQYIKLIKIWLKGEENYLSKVAPILKNSLHDNIFVN